MFFCRKPIRSFTRFVSISPDVNKLVCTILVIAFVSSPGCKDKTDDPRDKVVKSDIQKQASEQTTIVLNTADHWKIFADLVTPTETPIGAVVLLHQRLGSAADWKLLVDQLKLNGIVTLAIDQRGSGRSTALSSQSTSAEAPWTTSPDIAAAVLFLQNKYGKPGLHGANVYDHIGLVGASYGANNALVYAAEHPNETRSLTLFSPAQKYGDVDAIPSARKWKKPISIFYSKNDTVAGPGPKMISDASTSNEVLMYPYPGDEHGTELLNDTTVVATQIFLSRTLK